MCMSQLEQNVGKMKNVLESAIIKDGAVGQTSLIRSSQLIYLLHETIKEDIAEQGVDPNLIRPPIAATKPEMKIAGYLKRKDQDICVMPKDIKPQRRKISWGPEGFEDAYDEYGEEFTRHTLVINVRSQMSSLAKNTDTLFERTFAEPMNLHMLYEDMVLGEVYLIPVYEYDQEAMKEKRVAFSNNHTNLEKYISFFSSISGRAGSAGDLYKYERCALIIVDFSQNPPKLYHNTQELIDDNLVRKDFSIEYADISYDKFISKVLSVYNSRFGRNHIFRGEWYL